MIVYTIVGCSVLRLVKWELLWIDGKQGQGFDSFETEETEMKKKALWCKTLDEIITTYSNDSSRVNISKPSTLSPTIGVDNAVKPVGRIV